jgi:3'(2'), 5'-bisphosphate nucleotidase
MISPSLLETLTEIASEASAMIMRIYAEDFEVDYKGPDDPVTHADRQANTHICTRLGALFPDSVIVAEESEPEGYAQYATAERVFFVDPVDGTREFVRRSGEFVVMIGYVEHGRAIAGVIQCPVDGRTWVGEVGAGAFLRQSGQDWTRISPSQIMDVTKSRILVSRSQSPTDAALLTQKLGSHTLLALGSAGLKGAGVAEGSADAYIAARYAGKRWDVCAPDAIISAAGGVCTDCYGDALDYRAADLSNCLGLVAANPTLHETIIRRLQSIR